MKVGIFVVKSAKLLIFKQILNNKKNYYEGYKGYTNPLDPFVIFKVQLLVFFVWKYHNPNKNNHKEGGKN